jgi:hypothetical protein
VQLDVVGASLRRQVGCDVSVAAEPRDQLFSFVQEQRLARPVFCAVHVWELAMKRVALAVALLAVAGTASAAMFVPPPTPEPPRAAPARVEPVFAVAKPSAPAIIEANRPPVPFVRLPPPPAPQMATLVDQPPVPAPPPKPRSTAQESAKATIERGLASNGRCAGRPLTSVRVDGNGTVHVQC